MNYQTLGNTDLYVSRLCLGTMTMGWKSDKAESFALMDYALENGINFFDTADIYSMWVEGLQGGESEAMIGQWLSSRKVRDKMVIATKVRGRMWEGADGEGLSRKHLMRAVEDSLTRLQIETIDLYQTHWADDETPLEETFRAFEDMIQQGKVRYIGCSNHSPRQLKEALEVAEELQLPRYESLQPHYNLVHRQEYEAELRDICQKENLGVIPYSPLEGGFLTGKYQRDQKAPPGSRGAGNDRMDPYKTDEGYTIVETLTEIAQNHQANPAQIALAWLLHTPTITAAIVGANNVDQLSDTINAADISLSEEEKEKLDKLPAPK